jgi:hypothetical protein
MAIVQISQIQIRRGVAQDGPENGLQLASGEMGWTLDTRRLWIGNGTTAEGAPTEGVTEILTQYSNFLNSISNYTFAGTDSGYTSQTGSSSLTPVARTLQSVLDDMVSIRDFGAVGDGLTDSTAAINRAIQQIYPSTVNTTYAAVRRAIKFPAGTYIISGPIYIPPNCTLIGDGKNSTIISCTSGSAFMTSDAAFQTGGLMSAGSLPQFIFVADMKIITNAGTSPVLQVDSAIDVVFNQCYFGAPSSVTNLVNLAATSTVSGTKAVTFSGCTFDGGVNGIAGTGTNPVTGVRIANSFFINNTTYGIKVTSATPTMTGVVSENNYFDSSVPTPIFGMSGDNYSYGDVTPGIRGGLYSGSAKFGSGNTWTLSTGTNSITQFAAGAASMDYQLTDGTNYRFGTVKFNKTASGATSFDDDYTEPGTTMGANLFVNHDGNLTCTVATTTTFKYNIKQFI